MPERGEPLPIGRGRVIRRADGAAQGGRVALLSLGTRLAEALKAADVLEKAGFAVTVADARFAKPLDADLILDLAKSHEALVTIEEGSVGGFGSFVMQHLAWRGLLDHGLKVRPMCLPDRFIDHDAPKKQYDEAGLNAAHIVAAAVSALGADAKALPARA